MVDDLLLPLGELFQEGTPVVSNQVTSVPRVRR